MMLLSCSSCGTQYYAKRAQTVNYCSDACKQREYRKRKKQTAESAKRTMTLDEYGLLQQIEQKICDEHLSERVRIVLGSLPRSSWEMVLYGMADIANLAFERGEIAERMYMQSSEEIPL